MPGPVDKLVAWHAKIMAQHAVEKRYIQSLDKEGTSK